MRTRANQIGVLTTDRRVTTGQAVNGGISCRLPVAALLAGVLLVPLWMRSAGGAEAEAERLVNLALGRPVAVKETQRQPAAPHRVLDPQNLLTEKCRAGQCRGWRVKKDLPMIYANPTAKPVGWGGVELPPGGVAVELGPDRDVAIGWQSPIGGKVSVKAQVIHSRPRDSSDGLSVSLALETRAGRRVLAAGEVAPGGSLTLPAEKDADKLAALDVAPGDGLLLLVGKGGHDGHDTALIGWTLAEVGGSQRAWDLAKDVAADIDAGNPHADSQNNTGVWHFLARAALAAYPWSPGQLVDGVRVAGGYSCDPVYAGPDVDEWMEIDLGADRAFSIVKLFPIRAHARGGLGAAGFPVDFTVAVKPEGGAYATVKTVTGQVNPGVAPVILPLGEQKARFVKLAVSKVGEPPAEEKSYALRLAEVEVLGRRAREPQPKAQTEPPPQPHWRVQTDDTAVTVAVVDQRPVVWELGHPRQGWNWLPAPMPIPLPSQVLMQGEKEQRSATWKFLGATVDGANGKTLTLRFACNEAPNLQFACKWWAADGAGPIEYREVVENQTGKRVALSPQRDRLDLKVKAEREVVLWRFHKDAGAPVLAKSLFLDLLSDGSLHEVPIKVDAQNEGYGFIPFLALDGGIHGLYVAGEWQDGRIRVAASGARPVTVRMSLATTADRLDVPPGTAVTPALYLGAYADSVDDGCNAFKRWFFRHKSPENMRKDPTEPWTQFAAMWSRNPGWDQRQEVFAQGMKEKVSGIGIESVCIDYGWWSKKDRWIGDPEKWPGGMEMAGTLAHENGFKLTLYFKKCGNNLDWGKKLSECMTRYGVDTWRSDFGAPKGPGGLAMLDWLMANHPKFRYEFCDCGAPQKDFVMAQRATVFFGIDVYDPLSNRKMFHTSSYCLPPAQIQSPINVDPAFLKGVGPGVYAVRSAMQGAFDIGMNGSGPKICMPSDLPAMIEPAKQNLALYKTRLRPLVREADLYHITLPPDGVDWDGLQYQHPVSGQGAVLLFKPKSQADTRRFFLRGLDRGKTYTLTFQDRPEQNLRRDGAALMDDGFDVTMPGQEVSEIIWIEPAKNGK